MTNNNKCQSKKHPNGGCGNPRCPEGPSIETQVEDAVIANDLNQFLAAKEKLEEAPAEGLKRVIWQRKQSNIFADLKKDFDEQQIKQATQRELRSFENLEQLSRQLHEQFYPYLEEVNVVSLGVDTSGFEMKGLCVEMVKVKDEFQHKGIGKYVRATIKKFADEHDYVITSTPTTMGDGTILVGQEGFKEHALEHRNNLVAWYERHGYEYNYAFEGGTHDELTGEPNPKNPEWEKQFHPDALNFLKNSGFYIRWPHDRIPDNWKA